MKRLLIIILIVLTLVGCTPLENSVDIMENKMPSVKADTIEKEIVKANSKFAFDILHKLYEKDNVFISPTSISVALTMTYNGADNSTKAQMAKVLGFDGIDDNTVNASFAYLTKLLNREENGININLANSIWIRNGYPILESFKEVNKKYFAAMIKEMGFDKEDASKVINNWVKEKTNSLIDSIVDEKIDANTVMFLINAIYFKGEWEKEFDTKKTYESDFYVNDVSIGKVDMMSDKRNVLYFENDEIQVVSLPYKNKNVYMDIVLPKNYMEFNEIDYDLYKKSIQNMNEKEVYINLPKFEVEYKKSLKDVLKELGMKDAFMSKADFSKMCENSRLVVSDVKHKSYIDVNEKGTKAAAVTSVEVRDYSMKVLSFIANKPFMYMIRDAKTDSILFMGVFRNPKIN